METMDILFGFKNWARINLSKNNLSISILVIRITQYIYFLYYNL